MRVWALRHQAGAQYSAAEWSRAEVPVRSVVAAQPQSASLLKRVTPDVSLLDYNYWQASNLWWQTIRRLRGKKSDIAISVEGEDGVLLSNEENILCR